VFFIHFIAESKVVRQKIMNQNSRPMKEAALFFAITLGLAYFVFCGPLALFQAPTISFVSDVRGPIWAIVMYMLNAFGPSAVAIIRG
jgi:hypothetical protein